MSVQTQIDRISGAVSAALAALTEKGVTVPDGTKVDGLAALIAAIEAGGGGAKIATGSFTLTSNTAYYQIKHGLGFLPTLVLFVGDTPPLMSTNYSTIAGWAVGDVNLKIFYSSGSSTTHVIASDSGVNMQEAYNKISNKNSTFHNANSDAVDIGRTGGTYPLLIAGVTYYWFAM